MVFEAPVDNIAMGDVIEIRVFDGKILNQKGEVISEFELKSDVLLDEVRAGGRINLIVGRGLTSKARESLGLPASTLFRIPAAPADNGKGFTLAQKMVGRACGVKGIRPGTYCEPRMASVGSQDTTGPMTRDELKDLACLGFSADLVMQSFCHTAAYPKPVDIKLQHSLPEFMSSRGGVSLRPGDGVIHSWLNRMILPDTVGTGGQLGAVGVHALDAPSLPAVAEHLLAQKYGEFGMTGIPLLQSTQGMPTPSVYAKNVGNPDALKNLYHTWSFNDIADEAMRARWRGSSGKACACASPTNSPCSSPASPCCSRMSWGPRTSLRARFSLALVSP